MTSNAKPLAVVIMAAGKGTRMKSDLPKVLHLLAGKPLLSYVISTAKKSRPDKIVVVVGHGRAEVEKKFANEPVSFAVQEPQLGTGHAVMCAEETLESFKGDIIILSGDVPLLTTKTIERMISRHRKKDAAVTILTAISKSPEAYGRIVRDGSKVVATVEAKDATKNQLAITEINSGVYLFDSSFLFTALKSLETDNAQQEYYLTDLIAMAAADGLHVEGVVAEDHDEISGVNTLEDLAALEKKIKAI